MNKIILIISFVVANFTYSAAQQVTLKDYSNKLLFNLFTDHPDSSVCHFRETYIQPDYCHRPISDTIHGWHTGGAGPEKLQQWDVSIHTMLFTKHPFLNEKFSNGKLEIQIGKYFKNDFFWNSVSLYLYFLKPEDAKNTYLQMRSALSALSVKKEITAKTNSDTEIAEFSDGLNNTVQLIFAQDNIYDNYYYILFRNR